MARGAVVTLIAVSIVVATAAQTAEVRVMSAGATAPAYLQLVPEFESKTRLKAVTLATSTGLGADAIVARVRGGEPVDVIFLAANVLDDLVKEGLVAAASRIDIARSSIGVAVRAGAPKPDVASIDALKAALLQARSIAISSQISGVYLTNELLPRLGIEAQVLPKIRRAVNEPAGNLVARGEAEIGIQQISELLAVRGVDYVGPLPDGVQRVSTFAVGIATKAGNPTGARALIDLVMSAEGLAVLRQSGLDPIPRGR
jgi:molybdate transport system substrate-binding protein